MLKSKVLPWLAFVWVVGLLFVMSPVQAQGVEWQCDHKGVRSDNVGRVLWAYCYGVGEDAVMVRKRVILPDGITLQAEMDAAVRDVKQWVQTGAPDLMSRPASESVWNDPRVAAARQEMEDAIKAELAAGTVPKPRPWRVAPNASSTSSPPTRPMWDATGAKAVAERAYVGDVCNCIAPLVKGAQTLCPLRQLGDMPPTTNRTACERK